MKEKNSPFTPGNPVGGVTELKELIRRIFEQILKEANTERNLKNKFFETFQ